MTKAKNKTPPKPDKTRQNSGHKPYTISINLHHAKPHKPNLHFQASDESSRGVLPLMAATWPGLLRVLRGLGFRVLLGLLGFLGFRVFRVFRV